MRESVIAPSADGEFRIDEEHPRSGTAVLALHGDADLHSVQELRARLDDLVEGGTTTLIVDLSEVMFVDSTGLGALLEATKRLRARGGVLRIACPRPEVRRIFEITLLDRVFPLASTRSEALAAGVDEAGG